MRAHAALLALAFLLPACSLERALPFSAPPVGARTVRLCAAVDGRLRDFTGWIDPQTGDTLVNGRRFREAFPATYASAEPWYERREPLPITAGRYQPDGEPRTFSPRDLRRPGLERAHRIGGIDVFATLPRHADERRALARGADALWSPEPLFVPVNAGCELQMYVDPSDIGAVEG